MTAPLLIYFIGFPGSGKTTFANKLAAELGGVVLNSDALRVAIFGSREIVEGMYQTPDRPKLNTYTFGAMDYIAKNLLSQGIPVVYDAIQRTHEDRDNMLWLAETAGAVPVFVSLQTSVETAVQRGISRQDTPESRRFDENTMRGVVQHFIDELEPVREGERVVEISGEVPFNEQHEVFKQGVGELTNG